MKPNSTVKPILLSALCLAAGAGLLVVEEYRPGGGVRAASRFHSEALDNADLQSLSLSSTDSAVLRYQFQASRILFGELQGLFHERVPSVARPKWSESRNRAMTLAGDEYDELRQEVAALGRSRFQELSAEGRREIIESGTFNLYILEAGVDRLP